MKITAPAFCLLFIFLASRAYPIETGHEGMEPISSSTQTFSLDDAIATALRDNPEIRAARKKWEAAQSRIAQEATPDKPRVDLERMYGPRDKDVISGAQEKNIAVTQELPFPTTLYLRSKKASREAKKAAAQFEAKQREVIAAVKIAYAMLAQGFHHMRLLENNAELMKHFSRVVESKYAVGKATQSDALKAQVELARTLNMLVDMQQEKETSHAMLNFLLNKNPQESLGMPMMTEPRLLSQKLEAIQGIALKERPELKMAAYEVEAKRSSVSLARSEFLPDLMLQYRQRDMVNGIDSHDAVLGFSVPLWFWKQTSLAGEAKANLEMSEAEYESQKNMTRFEIQNLLTKFQTSYRLAQLYDTSVIPQAKQSLRVTEAAYQADKAGFLDLLEAARTLLTFQQDYYHTLTQSEVNFAELERVVGVTLEDKP